MPRKFDAAATLASAEESASQGRAEVREVASRAGIAVTEVSVDDLMPNPANPPHRSSEGLEELAASVAEVGLLQPLVVRPRRDSDAGQAGWMILGGHRRWGAAKLAGLQRLPVHVVAGEVDVQMMLVENLQRTDISPMEEARSFQLLRDQGYKQTQIASMVSVSQGHVSKRLGLLKMDDVVQDALDQGKVGLDAVYSVLNDTEPAIARRAVQQITEKSREVPATAIELTRAVQDTTHTIRREAEHDQAVQAADKAGAQRVTEVDLPEQVLRMTGATPQELAAVGAQGHLYFTIGDQYWDRGTYWTSDPTTLEADTPPVDQSLQAIAMGAARWLVIPSRSDASSIRGIYAIAQRLIDSRTPEHAIDLLGVVLAGVPSRASRVRGGAQADIQNILGDVDALVPHVIRESAASARECRDRGQLAHELAIEVEGADSYWAALRNGTTPKRLPGTAPALADDYVNVTEHLLKRLDQLETQGSAA